MRSLLGSIAADSHPAPTPRAAMSPIEEQQGAGWPLARLHVRKVPGFPLSDVPLQEIVRDAAAGRLDVKPKRVFGFEEIRDAHRTMEANEAGGKMVVVHR
jgi:NADPH:quinone reductase-like Zn-dependent oxidoreductase